MFINYQDLIDCDIIEDSASRTNGGLANAIAGGMLAGGVGALVGASVGARNTSKAFVTDLAVKIVVNNPVSPTGYIRLVSSKVKVSSAVYQNACTFANDIVSALSVIIFENTRMNGKNAVSQNHSDTVEEIRRYKQLLDEGIITETEFNEKKTQLLNL